VHANRVIGEAKKLIDSYNYKNSPGPSFEGDAPILIFKMQSIF